MAINHSLCNIIFDMENMFFANLRRCRMSQIIFILGNKKLFCAPTTCLHDKNTTKMQYQRFQIQKQEYVTLTCKRYSDFTRKTRNKG